MIFKGKDSLKRQGLLALGKFVVAPILVALLIPIVYYFKGNRSAVDYVDTYVQNFDSIYVTLPKDRYLNISGGKMFNIKGIKYNKFTGERIYMRASIFFIEKYKKFFEFIWIIGVEDFVGHKGRHYDTGGVQQRQLEDGMVLCVYVNRIQWYDKSYGTKANPMPVFLHRFVSGDKIDERNKDLMYIDSIYPNEDHLFYDYLSPRTVRRMRNTPDSINRKYVEYYLRYILPKDEFKRLFVK